MVSLQSCWIQLPFKRSHQENHAEWWCKYENVPAKETPLAISGLDDHGGLDVAEIEGEIPGWNNREKKNTDKQRTIIILFSYSL